MPHMPHDLILLVFDLLPAEDTETLTSIRAASRLMSELITPILFESITFTIEDGRWTRPGVEEFMEEMSPLIRNLRVSSRSRFPMRAPSIPQPSLIRILARCPTLFSLRLQTVQVVQFADLCEIIRACGSGLRDLSLHRVTWAKDSTCVEPGQFPVLEALDLNCYGPLQWISGSPSANVVKRLTFDACNGHSLSHLVSWIAKASLLSTLAVRFRNRVLRLDNPPSTLALVSRSITRLVFHTSDFDSFILVARILESSKLYALTHMTITHVIQEHEQAGFRGGSLAPREGYPCLASVHLRFLFLRVYPVDVDDQRNLRTSTPFLRACDANDILHHEFCGITRGDMVEEVILTSGGGPTCS